MGYDSDHPRSEGEVGKCGVAISVARRHGDAVRRHPARPGLDVDDDQWPRRHPVLLLRRGGREAGRADRTSSAARSRTTFSRSTWRSTPGCIPVEPALKVIVDMFEWGSQHTPLWNTISISGYHIREAGATAAQELGVHARRTGSRYVERGIARGLDVDTFARPAFILLGHPQRLLRGDREAAGGAPHLGAAHARAL